MKTYAGIILGCLATLAVHSQESSSVFNFLKLPVSSRATALGGPVISIVEDDATLIFNNPALLTSVSDKTMNLNFMTYMQGSKAGSAAFTRTAGKRGAWAATAQFAGYGSIKETTADNQVIGDVSALDMAVNGMYSYLFSDRWAGGVTGKMVYSKYGEFTSFAMAVDLGVNYYNEERDLSFSVVASNLGGQLKTFGDHHEKMPFDLQAGFSIGMAHAPIRLTFSMTDITRWSNDYYYNPEKENSFGKNLFNHFAIGVDVLPGDRFYVSAGYNVRRANEMKAAGSSHAAGLSFGAGMYLTRFKLGVAYAKFHVSTPTLVFNVSYSL